MGRRYGYVERRYGDHYYEKRATCRGCGEMADECSCHRPAPRAVAAPIQTTNKEEEK